MSYFKTIICGWLCFLLLTTFQIHAKETCFEKKNLIVDIDFYTPGKIKTAKLNSVDGYIACSSKKKYFNNETLHETRSFLQLEAQELLIHLLTREQKGEYNYKINGIKLIKEWNNNDIFFASFFIPKNSIIIEKNLVNTGLSSTTTENAEFHPCKSHAAECAGVLNELITQLERNFLGDSKVVKFTDEEIENFYNSTQDKRILLFLNLRKNPYSEIDLFEIAHIYECDGNKQVAIQAYVNLRKANAGQAEEIDFRICEIHESTTDYRKALDQYIEFNKKYPFSKHSSFVVKKIVELPLAQK